MGNEHDYTNFLEDYCKAGHNISRRFQVPLLWRIDLRGSADDLHTIDAGIQEHWEQLTERRKRRAPSWAPGPYPTPRNH